MRRRRRSPRLPPLGSSSPAALAPAWRVWAGENLLRGVARERVVAALCAQGVAPDLAAREVAALEASAVFAAARATARRVRQLEMVARLQAALARTAPHPTTVERREAPPADEFFDRYYATNTPVVLTDLVPRWPAMTRWSSEYLAACFGDVEVEVTVDRESDPDYDMNFRVHSRTMRLDEFAARVRAAGETNDLYLTANNRVMDRPDLQGLFDDVVLPEGYLDPARRAGCVAFWFGPAGTVTPLHHDTCNILFCQVVGRKRVLLAPPWEASLLEGARSVYAAVDGVRPDLPARPEMEHVLLREVVVGPGDALFIPVGWWHHVRALELSIGMAFSNFTRPNFFDWYKPGAVR